MRKKYIIKTFLSTLAGCFFISLGLAQSPRQSLRIQISYEKAGQYLEQAVETIDAVNIVGATAMVDYEAGRSVTLLPGFEAKGGSIFTASIKPISFTNESVLQLTAFPNPFEHATTIDYYLPADGKVNLWVMDAQGKVVGQLVQDENQAAGKHRVEWKPQTIGAGVYIPIIEANQQKATGRLVKK